MNPAGVTALVFDFDGTILDTETPVFESWAATFRHFGVEPVTLETWLTTIGMAEGQGIDMHAVLREHLGVDELPDAVDEFRLTTKQGKFEALPMRPGVQHWIDAAIERSIPLAVASSSPTSWVVPHLERLGLAKNFRMVSCADPGIPGKPDPTVYRSACQALEVEPDAALAIEDSTHGVSAAIAAGMRCVAAPGPITTTMDFSHATVRVDSLAELDPAAWLG